MKTVLITGANKGIGFETARQLAQLNYFVYLGSRNNKRGLEAIQKMNDLGITNVANIQIDVADINSVRQARQELEGKISALDILINNAATGGVLPQDFSTLDLKTYGRFSTPTFRCYTNHPGVPAIAAKIGAIIHYQRFQ